MTVGQDYLLHKPGAPSAPKQFLDTRVVPAAVNLAGAAEGLLERAAQRSGLRPSVILAGAAGLLLLLAVEALRERRPPPRSWF